MLEMYWISIEVLDGAFPAIRWKDAHGDQLTEAALMHGAQHWEWHVHSWGVVFELAFRDEGVWETFSGLAGVRAALDATPDPVNGLLVYPGRGGSSGRVVPRRPHPIAGADGIALPEPETDVWLDLTRTGADVLTARRPATVG